MLAGSAVLFVLVMALFLFTLFRPGFGSRLSPTGWIIAGGLILPLPVLTVLVYYALFQGERLLFLGASAEPAMRIEARARMWEWQFRNLDRPDMPVTINTLHIPVAQPVEIITTSDDVIHSFWVPRLGGKIDAMPGHLTRLRIMADVPGRFGGVCAEFCGTRHTEMLFNVQAHEPDDFAKLAETLQPSTGEAATE